MQIEAIMRERDATPERKVMQHPREKGCNTREEAAFEATCNVGGCTVIAAVRSDIAPLSDSTIK
jgi:hypothetical protein